MATRSLTRQSTPVAGARSDRTAAHAAVRNLAEAYGVDLLPLDLSLSANLDAPTPFSVDTRRRCSESAGLPSRQLGHASDIPVSPCTAVADALEPEVVPAPRQWSCAAEVPTCSPRKAAAAAQSDATAATSAAGGAASAAAAAALAAGGCADAELPLLDSCRLDECDVIDDEEGYLEFDVPLEQRISLLEEERDILVDKLLATTEALHASEARNRQSQASASQVGALLDQLQELLRRAEVERDKAKLQLKRQRVSGSSLSAEQSASADISRPAAASPLPQFMSAPLQATPDEGQCRSSTDDSGSSGCCDSPPAVGRQLRHRKKRKSSSEDGMLGVTAVPIPIAPTVQPVDNAAAPGLSADVKASTSTSDAGSRRRHGSSSEREEPKPAAALVIAPESSSALTPSSNEARPPVQSVINGFESLMNQRTRTAAARAAAARAAAAEAAAAAGAAAAAAAGAAAAAAAAAPAGFVAAAVASRQMESVNLSKEQAASAAGRGSKMRSIALSTKPATSPQADAAEEVDLAAAAEAEEAAAAAGVEAVEACAGLMVQVSPIWVGKRNSDDGCSAAAPSWRPAGSNMGSEVSTPTAAAVCNASPARFTAELRSLYDGLSDSEVMSPSDVAGPSYAEVVCRNSRDRSMSSSSRAASTSPAPCGPSKHMAASSSRSTLKQPDEVEDECDSGSPQSAGAGAAAAAVGEAVGGADAGVRFSFGLSSNSASRKGHCVSPRMSPKAGAAAARGAFHSPKSEVGTAGTTGYSASRLGSDTAAAAAAAAPQSVVAAAVAEAALVKQQQRQGVVYNPTAFTADCSSGNGRDLAYAGNAAADAAADAARAAVPAVAVSASTAAPAASVAPAEAGAGVPAVKSSSVAGKVQQHRQQQQQQQLSDNQQPQSAAAKKQHKQADHPHQQKQGGQQGRQQKVRLAQVEDEKQPGSALSGVLNVATPGSPADCTAEVVTCGSSNAPSSNAGTGKGPQKRKKQAAGPAAKAKGVQAAASSTADQRVTAAASMGKHASSSTTQANIGVFWRVAVVVLLLVSGGLFAALMRAMSAPQHQLRVTAAGGVELQQQEQVQLQQQLEATQDRVAVLLQQLSEKERQLASCSWQDAAAAGDAVGARLDR